MEQVCSVREGCRAFSIADHSTGAILYGNAIYSIGSILIAAAAQVRSFRFMIAGRIIAALGDIATQIAQYKIFSSWFPPSSGFASTLGLELGIGKIGSFVGKSSANVIAKARRASRFRGHIANLCVEHWQLRLGLLGCSLHVGAQSQGPEMTTQPEAQDKNTNWLTFSLARNLFTNFMTVVFYQFNKIATKKFASVSDPATGEKLTEKNKKFEIKKVLELPWVFWCIMLFSFFQTSTAIVFTQNATELAEQRFGTDSVTAGWYSATLQYAGTFEVVVKIVGHID